MINCAYLHKEFRYRVDAYNLSNNNYPSTPKIDSSINRAVSIWYKKNIELAETDATKRETLRLFIIPDVELDLEKRKDRCVAKYPKDFFQKSYFKVLAKKVGCEETGKDCCKYLVAHPVQGDDFNFAIKDPDRKPSYRYESILYSEKSDGIHFYLGDEGFEIKSIVLDYYKKIPKIQCPKQLKGADYILPDGSIVKRDIGLPDMTLDEVEDVLDIAAVIYLARINNKEELSNNLLIIKEKYKL